LPKSQHRLPDYPNFSIGMVLLQQAIQASQHFDHVEIIELHHNKKADALAAQRFKPPRCWQKWQTYNSATVEETENYQEPEVVYVRWHSQQCSFTRTDCSPGSDFWGSWSSLHFAS